MAVRARERGRLPISSDRTGDTLSLRATTRLFPSEATVSRSGPGGRLTKGSTRRRQKNAGRSPAAGILSLKFGDAEQLEDGLVGLARPATAR